MSEPLPSQANVADAAKAPAVPAPKPDPVTPEVPSQKAPDEMSAKFAALARKERMLRDSAGRFKSQESALAERERKIAEREAAWERELRDTPLEALKKRGLTYEDLTKAALNDGKFQPETEVKSVKSEVERLRQEMAVKDKQAAEDAEKARAAAEQEVVDAFKGRIGDHLGANKEKFELVNLYEASELVYQTVEEHYTRTKEAGSPKLLSIEEACQLVEDYLEGELDKTAKASKKFQTKYGQPQAKEDGGQRPAPKSSTTLTNQMASSAAPSLLPAATESDRIKRALAALG